MLIYNLYFSNSIIKQGSFILLKAEKIILL